MHQLLKIIRWILLLVAVTVWPCASFAQSKDVPSPAPSAKKDPKEKKAKQSQKAASEKEQTSAEKKKEKDVSSESKQKAGAKEKKETPKEPPPQKSEIDKKPVEKNRFVDRNGDGIHDGHEHRFRRRRQKRRHRGTMDDSGGLDLRQLHRTGQTGSSQPKSSGSKSKGNAHGK